MSFLNHEQTRYHDSVGEPMVVGGQSPSSPPSQQYLPEYLIGGAQQPSSMVMSSQQAACSPSLRTKYGHPSTPTTATSAKPSGPPVAGLFDEEPTTCYSPSFQQPSSQVQSPMLSQSLDQSGSFLGSPAGSRYAGPRRLLDSSSLLQSPSQVDPFYTQGEKLTCDTPLNENWVTIFGFPPSASSFVLQHFSQCGTILSHKVDTQGNWMHIQYQNKLQAKKALSKNGKVLESHLMVGVLPCIDLKAMEQTKENIRPLARQAYMISSRDHQVESPLSGNTPTRTPDLVNKALDFLFSW